MAEDAEVGSIGDGANCENKTIVRSLLTSKNLNGATGYLTPNARLAFVKLKKAFIKIPIFRHFDPECYIRIESNVSGHAIVGVLNQLTLENLGQWQPIAFYSQKMIPVKTRYKIHNSEPLAIAEAFKI